MKGEAISFVLNKNFQLNKSFYFISGNENTLMQKIKGLIVEKSRDISSIEVNHLKTLSEISNDVGLFSKNKLYIISDAKGIAENELNKINKGEDIFIFFLENSPKVKTIKNIFLKRSDSLVFDCYELSKELKTKIVKNYLTDIGRKLNQDLFWLLVEKLDNRYGFLEKELDKFKELNNEDLNEKEIKSVISRNSFDVERVFFQVLNKNEAIINKFNEKIKNDAEVNQLYYVIKQFSYLIINNNNQDEFEKNIPKYLFREKGFLIDLFKKFNKSKKNSLLNLLLKTEKEIRKTGDLSLVLGLRFLLNFKKLTTF